MKQKMYLENVIDLLGDFADKEYQVKVWLNINNTENLVGSFDETVNMLFDGEIFDAWFENNEIIVSKEVTKALQELLDIVDDIDENRSQKEIIDDPKMQIVRQKAAHALALIKASDGTESTVGFVKVGTADTPITIEEAFNQQP